MTGKTKTLVIVIGAVVALALLVGGAALAIPSAVQAASSAAVRQFGSQPAVFASMPAGRGGPGLHGRGGEEFNTYLAEALGITVEELQTAYAQAEQKMLEQAVAGGEITQEQADLRLAMQALRSYIDPQAMMAEGLGLSVEELQAAHEDGKTMRDLIEASGLSAEEFQAAMQQAFKAAVAQAVEDGVITQAQADLVLAQSENGMPGFGGPGRGHGRPGMPGQGGQRPFPGAPEQPEQAPKGTGG